MTTAKVKAWKPAQRRRGNRLVILLRDSGLNQYDIADALGISQATVSNYLGGRNRWPDDFEARFRAAVAEKRAK